MKRPTLRQTGIAAVILLVPGGLVLGAALAARAYKKRESQVPDTPADDTDKAG